MSDTAGIHVTDVHKAYEQGRIQALAGMNLHVAGNEYVALVGPSGCGKSTLLHLIAALDRPDRGTIRVAGHDRGGRVAHRMALDHSARIVQWAVLDIVPTRTMYLRTDRVLGRGPPSWPGCWPTRGD